MLYLTLFLEFLKIGLFTFGGGYAMIPLIREVVLKHGWLNEAQFLNMIGVAEVTPGPIAVNMATYVGSTQAGFLGALLCTLGVILPAFLIMLLISILLPCINPCKANFQTAHKFIMYCTKHFCPVIKSYFIVQKFNNITVLSINSGYIKHHLVHCNITDLSDFFAV